MLIKPEDNITDCLGEDTLFANELPEKGAAGLAIMHHPGINDQYLSTVELCARLYKGELYKMRGLHISNRGR
jgi:hypothetical protein